MQPAPIVTDTPCMHAWTGSEAAAPTSLAWDWGVSPELSRMRPNSVVNTTKLVAPSSPLEVSRRTVMVPCPRDFQLPCRLCMLRFCYNLLDSGYWRWC